MNHYRKHIRNGKPYWKTRLIRNFQYLGLFIFFTVYIINSSTLLKELFLNWWNTPATIVLAAESVTVMPVSATVTPSPSPSMSAERDEESEEIKKLICNIFGEKDCETAVKIAKCESGLKPYKIHSDEIEHSVGLFQVHIARDHGQGTHVHWNKIPGDNLEEKTEWLQVPENNILIAKFIYGSRGNWGAWYNCSKKIGV